MPRRWFTSKGASGRLFLCLLLFSCTAHARQTSADCSASHFSETTKVRSITDGDTLRLQDGRKLRLIGINTPELAHDGRPAEAYASDAKTALAQLFKDSKTIRLLHGIEEKDRYGRTLAHAFLEDGRNVQTQLLRQGMALSIALPPNTRLADCYSRQEKIARCEKAGIWRGKAVISTGDLTSKFKGFALIKGKIRSININSKGIWLNMDNRLTIGVRPDNRELFDLDKLGEMLNQVVVVRGWVNHSTRKKYPNPFYIRVRHPSSLQDWGAFGCR